MDLNDLIRIFGAGKNIGNSPGTYIPYDAKFREVPYLPGAAGMVNPMLGKTNAWINYNAHPDQYEMARTVAHEAAHTEQNLGLLNALWPRNKFLNSAQFPEYNQTPYPHPNEIAATLRETEAFAPKGQTWDQTELGRDYLRRLSNSNPTMNIDAIKREVDRQMFPKYGVMHEGPGFLEQKVINAKQQARTFLENLFQK